MHIHALITGEILSGDRPIEYISYSRDADSVFVMVSHAATWELGGMRRVDWDTFVTDHAVANVEFLEGDHLLQLDTANNAWREVPQ